MRRFSAVLLLGTVAPLAAAQADTICDFTLECYMTEPCAGSGWELTVDDAAGVLSTVFGDLAIQHEGEGTSRQIMATGEGSVNLLTIGDPLSVFTTHVEGDAAAITYVGECRAE